MKKLTILVIAAILCCMISCENEDGVNSVGSKNNPEFVEAVDLGLSVKWASCNVGATKPEEYGDYFAWGETSPKATYNWRTYKYCKGSNNTLTKYCTDSYYGTVDNKTTLDPEDDAAHVNWGGAWRMPTRAEQNELLNNCTWTKTTQNGVKGYIVSSKKNSHSIFLPASSCCDDTSLNFVNSYTSYYWSSTLGFGNSKGAYFFSISMSPNRYNGSGYGIDRVCGLSVRPVCP
ncbi:MAG: DUF1566 domain-containing protein [Paludibacteraceae bacterium]|nr:DUF1566 domain-containing protein [Paludibacteraceae bacterium]